MDLAQNRPGLHAVATAHDLRSRTPIRSHLGGALGLSTPDSPWWAAAEGERQVAVTLDRLGADWQILHSIPVGPDHPAISHLAIGPPGVFNLISRQHRKWRRQFNPERVEAHVLEAEIRIDGLAVPYLPQARAQAWRASRALSAAVGEPVHVRPAVVLVGCEDIRLYGPPDRVEVLARRHLSRWLRGFPVRYRDDEVHALFAAARRRLIWTDHSADQPNP